MVSVMSFCGGGCFVYCFSLFCLLEFYKAIVRSLLFMFHLALRVVEVNWVCFVLYSSIWVGIAAVVRPVRGLSGVIFLCFLFSIFPVFFLFSWCFSRAWWNFLILVISCFFLLYPEDREVLKRVIGVTRHLDLAGVSLTQ